MAMCDVGDEDRGPRARWARVLPFALAVALVCSAVPGCGAAGSEPAARVGDLTVVEPALVAPPGGSAALYLRVRNDGTEGDRLIGLSAPIAAHASLHRTRVEGGRATMKAAPEGFPVGPGEVLQLTPGGRHGMLMGIASPPEVGTTVAVALSFEKAGGVTLQVPVIAHAGAGGGGHEGH